MKDQNNKHIESFTKKAMHNAELDNPSEGFATSVMYKIEVLQTKKATTYHALISKPVWLVLSVAFMLFMVYLFNTTSVTTSTWAFTLDLDLMTPIGDIFNSIKLSTGFSYVLLSLSIMVLLQVTWMKRYFDKRLDF